MSRQRVGAKLATTAKKPGRGSQERAELFLGQPGLPDRFADGERGELAIVEGNDQTPGRGTGGAQVNVTAGLVVDREARPLERR